MTAHVPDITALEEEIRSSRSLDNGEERLRPFLAMWGIYRHRAHDSYLVRLRVPLGIVEPTGLRAIAQLAAALDARIHLTTRQDIQLHGLSLDRLPDAIRAVSAAGFSSYGTGGNTLRNVTCSPEAGVCPEEPFDVTPHALGLAQRLAREDTSYRLPRKMKFAFSCCGRDTACTAAADLGFIPSIVHCKHGFRVVAGGGLGATPALAQLLHEFLPASEVQLCASAVRDVFAVHGAGRPRNRARLRFLVQKMGFEQFAQLYHERLSSLRSTFTPDLVDEREDSVDLDTSGQSAEDAWIGLETATEKSRRHRTVYTRPVLGCTPEQLGQLAQIGPEFARGGMRLTPLQDIALRSVHDSAARHLREALADSGFTVGSQAALRGYVSCQGAPVCRLGTGRSSELIARIQTSVTAAGLDPERLRQVSVAVSGCQNACSRHWIADIGFFGVTRRCGDAVLPHYQVLIGGGGAAMTTPRLAVPLGWISADRACEFAQALLADFAAKPHSSFREYLENGGLETARRLLEVCSGSASCAAP